LKDWASSYSTELQLLVGLILLVAVFSSLEPSIYPTQANMQNITRQAGILLVVAIGQMFAITIGGFDLSVGAHMGFTSVVTSLVMADHGLVAGIVVGLVAAAVVGLTNGILVAWVGISPFVVTLAMLNVLIGLANDLSGGASTAVREPFFRWFGGRDWGAVPSTIGIGLIVLLVAVVLAGRTRAGLYVYGIGGSRETCRLAGVPVVRYEILTYTITGFLAGVGGIMLASRVSVGQAGLGAGYEMRSIAAAVIGGAIIGGGAGRLSGVVLGVSLMTCLTVGLDVIGVGPFRQQIAIGFVLVVAVLISQMRGGTFQNLAHLLPKMRRQPPPPDPAEAEGMQDATA
jgi:ribose transport system permease protein